jgi:hypothetical protein
MAGNQACDRAICSARAKTSDDCGTSQIVFIVVKSMINLTKIFRLNIKVFSLLIFLFGV